jgi:hypothetical protein
MAKAAPSGLKRVVGFDGDGVFAALMEFFSAKINALDKSLIMLSERRQKR